MNALPIQTIRPPRDVIDELVTNFGIRQVLLAVIKRMFKRSRPPDADELHRALSRARVEGLSDHLRKDMGLPPDTQHRFEVELISITNGFIR